jgi:4-hydroxyphenylpyruvate dioxygenase
MGPFPHDAPKSRSRPRTPPAPTGSNSSNSPIPSRGAARSFARMGYATPPRHKTKPVELWQQGDITYVLNAEPGSFAARFVEEHGPCAPSMAWRVVDAQHAFDHAVGKGPSPMRATTRPGRARDQGDRRR